MAMTLGVSGYLIDQGQQAFQNSRMLLVAVLIVVLIVAGRKRAKDAAKQPQPRAEEFLEAGNQLKSTNRLHEAVKAYTLALKINQNDPEAAHNRGLCYAMLGDNQAAMHDFDLALSLRPDFADCWYNRACCLAVQGKGDESYQSLKQAIALNPKELKPYLRQDPGFAELRKNDPRIRQLADLP